MKAKVDALTDKLRAATAMYKMDVTPVVNKCNVELQLLDALLEQKRISAALEEK
jgi:hypothetical protein